MDFCTVPEFFFIIHKVCQGVFSKVIISLSLLCLCHKGENNGSRNIYLGFEVFSYLFHMLSGLSIYFCIIRVISVIYVLCIYYFLYLTLFVVRVCVCVCICLCIVITLSIYFVYRSNFDSLVYSSISNCFYWIDFYCIQVK